MSEFLSGHQFPTRSWDDVARWLVHSLGRLDVGDILEIGPSDAMVHHADEHVPCAQFQALEDGCRWMRQSTTMLGVPLLVDFSTAGLQLDVWHHDGAFDDCTDGYLFSTDHDLLAHSCVAWFRDRHGLEFDQLGCELQPADRLPRQ